MATIGTNLQDEISELIFKHLDELGEYIPNMSDTSNIASERILRCVQQLSEIIWTSPDLTTRDAYTEALSCRHTLECFLKSMNQELDHRFEQTRIGQIWVQAQMWCQKAANQCQLTVQEVWDFIAPVTPDYLNCLGNGEYEARWWKPAPMMDVEILSYTEGVILCGEAFEPANLPGGIALRFAITRFS